MVEYIERKAVSEAVKHAWAKGIEPLQYIEIIPSADVAPVVHGRWDGIPNSYISVASKDSSYSGHVTSCSVCHEINPNAYKTNYCPNCGAKMDGGGRK